MSIITTTNKHSKNRNTIENSGAGKPEKTKKAGRWGKALSIDLTAQTFEEQEIPAQVLEQYLGGKGLATWYLYQLTGKKVDPFSPENPVILATGALTGTGAPAMRGVIVTTSPQTGGYVDSYYGGHFAQEIKYCGYDLIIITGESKNPVYITLENDKVSFLSAENLWGKETFATNHAIKQALGDDSYRVACIGPGGENKVPFALVSCEYNRHAGRGGIGAVLGSKKLKALALKGDKTIPVAEEKDFADSVRQARAELGDAPAVKELTEYGTAAALWFADQEGLLPVSNYRKGTFNPGTLANEAQKEELWLRDTGCHSCPIRCSKVGVIRTGKRRKTVTDIVEYETAALMGTNLELKDIKEVAYLVYLCDALGLDGMSCGSTIGFAMECFEAGVFKPEEHDNIKLEFGSSKHVPEVIEQIARREGTLGKLLANGVAGAAKALGEKGMERAVHVKGMDIPAWGPRGTPGMGLAYLTADRGACHQRAFPVGYEAGGEPFEGRQLERLAVKGKAAAVISDQNFLASLDTMVICNFGSFGISGDTYRKMYEAATGETLSEERLLQTGERIWNLSRLFNLRQGINRETEKLPPRFAEPLPDGPAAGHKFTAEDQTLMLEEYDSLRGWEPGGIPGKEKLTALGITTD